MRPALTFIAGVLLIWAVANGRAAKLWEAVTGVPTGAGAATGSGGGTGSPARPPDPSTGTGGGVGHSGDPSHNG